MCIIYWTLPNFYKGGFFWWQEQQKEHLAKMQKCVVIKVQNQAQDVANNFCLDFSFFVGF